MTSNVGSSVIEKGGGGLGFQLNQDREDNSYNRIKSLVNEELKQYFRPEFLNRLDEIIVFRQLTKVEVKEIADIMLKEVFKRCELKGVKLDVTERFKDRLVTKGIILPTVHDHSVGPLCACWRTAWLKSSWAARLQKATV
eukprot:jgi/Pico_ML_1/50682/g1849.t1